MLVLAIAGMMAIQAAGGVVDDAYRLGRLQYREDFATSAWAARRKSTCASARRPDTDGRPRGMRAVCRLPPQPRRRHYRRGALLYSDDFDMSTAWER